MPLLIFIFSSILFAENINISIQNHKGESSYIVKSDDSQNLKSKLIFPFYYQSMDVSYEHDLKYFNITLFSSFLLNQTKQIGKDYDWQNKKLTVFSKSTNNIDEYYNIGINISKPINNNTNIFLGFKYNILDMHWRDTYQEDYVINKNTYIQGKALNYNQNFYQYILGINYDIKLTKKVFFTIKPSLFFSLISARDNHILRDFYTITNTKAFGLKASIALKYQINANTNISILLGYMNIKDKTTNMDYFNRLNYNYLSYPSLYSFEDTTFKVMYSFGL